MEHMLRVFGMELCPRRSITRDNFSEQKLPTEVPLKNHRSEMALGRSHGGGNHHLFFVVVFWFWSFFVCLFCVCVVVKMCGF